MRKVLAAVVVLWVVAKVAGNTVTAALLMLFLGW